MKEFRGNEKFSADYSGSTAKSSIHSLDQNQISNAHSDQQFHSPQLCLKYLLLLLTQFAVYSKRDPACLNLDLVCQEMSNNTKNNPSRY